MRREVKTLTFEINGRRVQREVLMEWDEGRQEWSNVEALTVTAPDDRWSPVTAFTVHDETAPPGGEPGEAVR